MRDDIVYEFKTRAEAVANVGYDNFNTEVKYFYDFLEENSFFRGILQELESINFDVTPYMDEIKCGMQFNKFPNKREEQIVLFNFIMRAIARGEIDERHFIMMKKDHEDINGLCRSIVSKFFIPVYKYFCGKIKANNTMLYLLDKYRHRTEWFHKERLINKVKDQRNIEDILMKDLQEYLHDQGIDYPFSTPLSPSGRVDLLGLIDSSNPLVLEIKLFYLKENYGKTKIRQGLWQAYKYAKDYGKTIGYLLIFNLDKKDIEFEKFDNEPIKSIKIGNKIIYIIPVKLYIDEKPASKAVVLTYLIEDEYLKTEPDKEEGS
jgi:hypothetical protein